MNNIFQVGDKVYNLHYGTRLTVIGIHKDGYEVNDDFGNSQGYILRSFTDRFIKFENDKHLLELMLKYA
jgi:hypothetical protein